MHAPVLAKTFACTPALRAVAAALGLRWHRRAQQRSAAPDRGSRTFSLLRAANSTLPPSWLPDAEWADTLEESLLTSGFPVNVVTLGLYLAPATKANGVTQLLAALPVQAPVTTAVEAVVQVP